MLQETLTRHNTYYLDVVIIRVENHLFRIPRDILTSNSPIFADMFSIPAGEAEVEGQSDSKPIHLEQVKSADFERLKTDRSLRTSSWGEAEWMSVLSLADKWQMSRILNIALENLRDVIPPTTKILFGQRYNYSAWTLEGFEALCLREAPLSEEEGRELGIGNVLKCFTAREGLWEATARASYQEGRKDSKLMRPYPLKRSQYGGPNANDQVTNIVRDVLGWAD